MEYNLTRLFIYEENGSADKTDPNTMQCKVDERTKQKILKKRRRIFGKKMQRRRKKLRKNQDVIGAEAKISMTTVSNIETGQFDGNTTVGTYFGYLYALGLQAIITDSRSKAVPKEQLTAERLYEIADILDE